MRDLVNVEAIPFEVLDAGITWDWETFPQYLDAAERRKPALNLAFLAPLTPLRHYVMGEASMERAATLGETAEDQASCWAKRWTPARSASPARCSTSTWASAGGRSRAATPAARS